MSRSTIFDLWKTEEGAGPIKNNKQCVLIVDDDGVTRFYLSRVFTAKGHHAVAVSAEQEAMATLQQHHFDLALLDIQLEEMSDGIALAQKIRALWPNLKIALMSGDPLNFVKAEDAGFKSLFLKPALFSDIESLLPS